MSDPLSLPFDAPEPAPAGPARHVITVSELTAGIRGLVETAFFEVWVEGEISNSRKWNTGHLYFTLKDSGAQMRAVMFRSALRYLRFRPEDGLHVLARGRITVYEPKGEYQLVCEHLEPHGTGALQLAFEQLKRRLQSEGLFDTSRKRPLPVLPRKIGIVTSLDGAALRDIVKVLRRRYPNAHLIIRPSRVQGDGAGAELARALREIVAVKGVDVVIFGRGGGSAEDLQAFNEEVVARAIAASPVPVVSAVGHEIDVTIADLVADLRAPTPSAAAELVVARKDEFCDRIDRLSGRLHAVLRAALERRHAAIHRLMSRRGIAGFHARVAMRGRRAAELAHDLRQTALNGIRQRDRRYRSLRQRLEARDLQRRIAVVRQRLAGAEARLERLVAARRHGAGARLQALAARLETLSPLAVLARGYAVCWNAERTAVIREASAVERGETVKVKLHRGELTCHVQERTTGGE